MEDIVMNNKRMLAALMACTILVTGITGCKRSELIESMKGSMSANTDIQLSVEQSVTAKEREALTWVPVDQLKTYPEIRDVVDDKLNIIKFGQGSKNGSIFIDTEGNWTGNTTLFYAFNNKEFVKNYWENNKVKSAIAAKAVEQFSDIKGESNGIYAAINAYYNIMPANADGTSGLTNYISRKEAMTALYRADTPVTELEENSAYNEKFGEDACNKYACNVENCSYLQTSNNSLNKYTYNAAITKAEAVYMIVNRYFKDEYDKISADGPSPFTDCKNAGDILANYEMEKGYSWQTYSLEISLQNKEDGVSEDLYKALLVGYKHGIIGNTTNWFKGVAEGDFLIMLVKTYNSMFNDSNYPVNAKTGYNEGNTIKDETVETEEEVLEGFEKETVEEPNTDEEILEDNVSEDSTSTAEVGETYDIEAPVSEETVAENTVTE